MRHPASVDTINLYGCDYYERYNVERWSAQKGTVCPPLYHSGNVYGHSGYEVDWPSIVHWRADLNEPSEEEGGGGDG